MHPAPSLIAFTVLSGLGFGLMIWLGLSPGDKSSWVMGSFCALALILSGAGLLSSLLHLGHPERAWRALSQWQSSWLSREGVLAVATLIIFTLYAAFWVLWDARIGVLGLLSALLALMTIASTAMIYGQLKTVPRWHSWQTPVLFVLFALTGGALLAGEIDNAVWLLTALAALQALTWVSGDSRFGSSGSTMETATGLSSLGKVRQLEPPHTGPNYLLTEMVHVVGRKHAAKLRIIALVLATAVPLVLILLGLAMDKVGHFLAGIVFLSHLAGALTARWLFFAEAEHVVGLYYGKR